MRPKTTNPFFFKQEQEQYKGITFLPFANKISLIFLAQYLNLASDGHFQLKDHYW